MSEIASAILCHPVDVRLQFVHFSDELVMRLVTPGRFNQHTWTYNHADDVITASKYIAKKSVLRSIDYS